LELDPGHGRLTLLGAIERPDVEEWIVSRDGERVAARSRKLFRLFTVRTETLLAELPLGGDLAGVLFLSEGRLLLDERLPGSTVLHLLDRDGGELRRFPFPATRVILGGEVAPGRLTLAARAKEGWTAFLLDLDKSVTIPLGRQLMPAGRGSGPESIGPRLFVTRHNELALLDPATGRLRIVLRTHRER
jgi:hypothetical protein